VKQIIKYQCDFCLECFIDEKLCQDHENKICFRNPKLKNCRTCFKYYNEEYPYLCLRHMELNKIFSYNCVYWEEKTK